LGSIIPTDRGVEVSDWITELNEIFASWETPASSVAFRARFRQLEQFFSAAHACGLARLLSEWQAYDGADLLSFAIERSGRPAVLKDDTVLRWSLQFLFHQEPEVVLPFLYRLVEDEPSLRRLTEKWLLAAGGQDLARRRALVEHYNLVTDDQVLRLSDPQTALADALASGESIEDILIAWGHQNPCSAWKAAKEHLDPYNGGYVFEKIFFRWSTTRPMEAFEFRHDMI
jgi:hypothetical protein